MKMQTSSCQSLINISGMYSARTVQVDGLLAPSGNRSFIDGGIQLGLFDSLVNMLFQDGVGGRLLR